MTAEIAKLDGFRSARGRMEGEQPDTIDFDLEVYDVMKCGNPRDIAVSYAIFVEEARERGYSVAHWEDMARNVVCFRLRRLAPRVAPEIARAIAEENPLRAGAIDV